jgi:FAD/FMN-containing dehydrogenase/Fe-S oxidoreductase
MTWNSIDIKNLSQHFEGKLYFGDSQTYNLIKKIYATDASVYQVEPLGVAIPKTIKDIKRLIHFAHKMKVGLIPRGAGTSLAGQVVGDGIVMEISSELSKIISLHKKEKYVWIEPGIIRDDLNKHLAHANLFFGPETSTASRALLGGMLGNNSSGLHSIVWGDVRDHLLETRAYLSDGSEIHTHPLSNDEFYKKTTLNNLEGKIYKELHRILNNDEIQNLIKKNYPKETIKRRNTGYALDALINMQPFNPNGSAFNLSALLSGSEGTLAIVHSMKLNLLNLPDNEVALVCVHCNSLNEALLANLVALNCQPTASELVDDFILSFTEGHPQFNEDRSFIEGNPAAILMVEFRSNNIQDLHQKIEVFIEKLKENDLSYASPVLFQEDINKGWNIRKAGLGLIRNLIGEEQAVNLIEDCAVDPVDLPNYANDIQILLKKHSVKAAFYAHAGAGELHIEPFINLKSTEGIKLFRAILTETVQIVKKYQGSLSGEHGDGRLRGEFIPHIMGNELYQIFKEIKNIFDPNHILNPGKIVDTPPMDQDFRYSTNNDPKHEIDLFYRYGEIKTPLALAEKCSGSGDCKKSALSGGTMCPSFMATNEEKDSTRARANMFRQVLANATTDFSNPELHEVLELCLSCKACKTECPSGVDISKLKAEALQQTYLKTGIPFRTKLIGNFPTTQKLASKIAPLYNFAISFPLLSIPIKTFMGFAWQRSLPKVSLISLESWFNKYAKTFKQENFPNGYVYLFADEFTNYNDVHIGKKTILLLNELGYGVKIPKNIISGRSYISKGMLAEAKKFANQNVITLHKLISENTPLIGIEPSALLSFRDEIPNLVDEDLKLLADELKPNCLLLDEFISNEFKRKKITKDQFTADERKILLHGHCHQKAIAGITCTRIALTIPSNYQVELMPTGCCGMAGSFGYEKKNFEVSNKIGNLVLFPKILKAKESIIVASNGTSCRHQIKDGIEHESFHTAEILYDALINKKFI